MNQLIPVTNTLLSISLSVTILVLCILLVRKVLGRWIAPKWQYALWLLVVARLMLPVAPPSVLSIENVFHKNKAIGTNLKSFTGVLRISPSQSADEQAAESAVQASPVKLTTAIDWRIATLLIWLIGTFVLLAITLRNRQKLRAITHRALSVDDPEMLRLISATRSELHLRQSIPVYHSNQVAVPFLAGIARPAVYIPTSLMQICTHQQLRFILLHEFIHIKRGDHLISCVTAFLQAIYWFHPMVWLTFYTMRRDRELACDANVINHIGTNQSADYGRTLLRLAEGITIMNTPRMALGIIKSKSETGRRVIMITKYTNRNGFVSVVIAGVIAVSLIAINFTSAQPQAGGSESSMVPAPTSVGTRSKAISGTIPASTNVKNPMTSTPLSYSNIEQNSTALDGHQPFTIVVDEKIGELVYTFDEKTKELEYMDAKKGVVFSTRGTTITCETFHYDVASDTIKAHGEPARFIGSAKFYMPMFFGDNGDESFKTEANDLTLNMKTGALVLKNKATIYQKDSSGKVTTTGGDVITLENVFHQVTSMRVGPTKDKKPLQTHQTNASQ